MFTSKCQGTCCQGWNVSLDPINLCVHATTYVSPAKHVLEAFASSWSIWAACDVQCLIPHGKSLGHLRKGCWTFVSDMLMAWPMIWDALLTSAIPLGTRRGRMRRDAQGIHSIELNVISLEEFGMRSKTSVCVRENC